MQNQAWNPVAPETEGTKQTISTFILSPPQRVCRCLFRSQSAITSGLLALEIPSLLFRTFWWRQGSPLLFMGLPVLHAGVWYNMAWYGIGWDEFIRHNRIWYTMLCQGPSGDKMSVALLGRTINELESFSWCACHILKAQVFHWPLCIIHTNRIMFIHKSATQVFGKHSLNRVLPTMQLHGGRPESTHSWDWNAVL